MSFMLVKHDLHWDEWTTHCKALWCYFHTRQWCSPSGCSRWCSRISSSVFKGMSGMSSNVWGVTVSALCFSQSSSENGVARVVLQQFLTWETHVLALCQPVCASVQVHKVHPDIHLIVTLSCYHVTDKLVDDSSCTSNQTLSLLWHQLLRPL